MLLLNQTECKNYKPGYALSLRNKFTITVLFNSLKNIFYLIDYFNSLFITFFNICKFDFKD